VLLCVVGVSFLALETLFGSSKVCSDEAVVKVVISQVSGSVLVALRDLIWLGNYRCTYQCVNLLCRLIDRQLHFVIALRVIPHALCMVG